MFASDLIAHVSTERDQSGAAFTERRFPLNRRAATTTGSARCHLLVRAGGVHTRRPAGNEDDSLVRQSSLTGLPYRHEGDRAFPQKRSPRRALPCRKTSTLRRPGQTLASGYTRQRRDARRGARRAPGVSRRAAEPASTLSGWKRSGEWHRARDPSDSYASSATASAPATRSPLVDRTGHDHDADAAVARYRCRTEPATRSTLRARPQPSGITPEIAESEAETRRAESGAAYAVSPRHAGSEGFPGPSPPRSDLGDRTRPAPA